MATPKVIDRIRKLLAVAHGKGASPSEVETAARLAHDMMVEHKLSELDVGEKEAQDGSAIVDLPAGKEGFMASWRFALITNVARAFFCEALGMRAGRSRKVRIIGRRDDAEVVLAVMAFLAGEIERLTEEYAALPQAAFAHEDEAEGTSAADRKKAYRAGLAYGVSSTLEEQARRWRESSEKALALYRKSREEIARYHENKFGQPRKAEPDGAEARLTAFEHGYMRGKLIEIGPAKEAKLS